MDKEEIDVGIMNLEELEDFEYLIQNYSKSKLAYKIIKIEEECKSYYSSNFKLQQENKQLKERVDNQEFLLLSQGKELKDLYSKIEKTIKYLEEPNRDTFDFSKTKIIEILEGDSNE